MTTLTDEEIVKRLEEIKELALNLAEKSQDLRIRTLDRPIAARQISILNTDIERVFAFSEYISRHWVNGIK